MNGSILQYPDAINAPEVQIWNNAAFDNEESEDSVAIRSSSTWWSQSIESNASKENLSPVFEKSPVSALKSSISLIPINPLRSNNVLANLLGNPLKAVPQQGCLEAKNEKNPDERKIDMEIEEIEKEISRLSSRLEALRLEKAEKSIKSIERRGRIVPAKFMEQKQSSVVKIEEPLLLSAKSSRINRRGVSLGPAEIYSSSKSRLLLSKQEMTPVSTQIRRKSCFWKLGEIDELKVTKERGKSSSVSPRSRKSVVSKIQAPKQAATTVGSKRPVKKEDGFLALIRPKTLFKDGEKSVPGKKPTKPGRAVPSRYNQIPTNQSNGNLTTASEARKRSLPDNDKDDGNKRRASRGNGVANQRMENSRVKKKWEIPSEVVVYKGCDESEESPPSASVMADVLPKIRTNRCVKETPRDSGGAKRVADLVGRKSYFCVDEEAEVARGAGPGAGDSVCQALNFEEKNVEEE